MASHLELIQELQQLDKVPSLERLRAAQKRRTQQLKRWAVYEKEMQNKKRKADKKGRNANNLQQTEYKRHVSFAASVALLEASARNDPDEGKGNKEYFRFIGKFTQCIQNDIQVHLTHDRWAQKCSCSEFILVVIRQLSKNICWVLFMSSEWNPPQNSVMPVLNNCFNFSLTSLLQLDIKMPRSGKRLAGPAHLNCQWKSLHMNWICSARRLIYHRKIMELSHWDETLPVF